MAVAGEVQVVKGAASMVVALVLVVEEKVATSMEVPVQQVVVSKEPMGAMVQVDDELAQKFQACDELHAL